MRRYIPQLLECGADGIALSGTVLNAADPVHEMKEIANIISSFNL